MRLRELLNIFFGFLFLAIAAGLLFLGVKWIVQQASTMESQVSSSIIAGSVAFLIAAMGYAFQATWNRKREIEEAQRPAKTELYKRFVDHWFRVMNIGNQSQPNAKIGTLDKKMIDEQVKISKEIILWGSDEVITAYRLWWETAKSSELDPVAHSKMIAQFEDLLFAFRRDLGHRNRNLDRKHLLGLFINDIHTVDLSDFPRNDKG